MSKEHDPRRLERTVAKYFGGELVHKRERLKRNYRFMRHPWLNLEILLNKDVWGALNKKLLHAHRSDPSAWLTVIAVGKENLNRDNYLVVMKATDFKDLHIGSPEILDELEREVKRENSAEEFLGWTLGSAKSEGDEDPQNFYHDG